MRLEAERIEIGIEMPARAVGADQHQGADRIARCLLDFGGGDIDPCGLRSRLALVAERALGLAPIAIERRNELAARRRRPARPLPRPAGGARDRLASPAFPPPAD